MYVPYSNFEFQKTFHEIEGKQEEYNRLNFIKKNCDFVVKFVQIKGQMNKVQNFGLLLRKRSILKEFVFYRLVVVAYSVSGFMAFVVWL